MKFNQTLNAITNGMIETAMITAILAVVAILTYMSFIFELAAFHHLFGETFGTATIPIIAVPVLTGFAIALNSAKVALTWLLAQRKKAGATTLFGLHGIRGIIFINSAIMTLLVCSFQITDLNAGKLLDAERERHRAEYTELRSEVLDQTATTRSSIIARNETRRATAIETYTEKWATLDAELRAESQIGGQNFRGARYTELEARMTTLEEDHGAELNALDEQESSALQALEAQQETRLADLSSEWNKGVSTLSLNDFAGTSEAQNPALVRFVATIENLAQHEKLTPQMAAIIMTLLITLLIEVLPIILFGSTLCLTRRAGTAERSETANKLSILDGSHNQSHNKWSSIAAE